MHLHPVLQITLLSSPDMQKELASTTEITGITKCIIKNKTDSLEKGYCGYTSKMEEVNREYAYIHTYICYIIYVYINKNR